VGFRNKKGYMEVETDNGIMEVHLKGEHLTPNDIEILKQMWLQISNNIELDEKERDA